jgi:dienelactone hydrolase
VVDVQRWREAVGAGVAAVQTRKHAGPTWLVVALALACGCAATTSGGGDAGASVDAVDDVEGADLATSGGDGSRGGDSASDAVAAADASDLDGPGGAADADVVADSDAGDVADDSDAGDAATDAATAPPLWDVALIEDAADAQCAFTDKHSAFKDGVALEVWKLSYQSYESIDGKLQKIQIRAFAARPQGSGALPGVVQAHGLGGFAKESHATGVAALTGAFVVAYTGPGGGDAADNTSGGLPSGHDGGKRMFDVFPDVRGSWFWGHAMAARRALTCLANHPEVDASRLGITGFSAGGVASFLVAGADARVKAAVPLSGVLAWDVATQSPNAWQHVLLAKAGLSIASPAWTKLMDEVIAPGKALAAGSGKLFLVNGSSDEFFPLSASASTTSAWLGPRWLSVVGNFDHGVYQVYGAALPGGAAAITAAADLRARGAQRALFHHAFATDADYATLPQPPTAQLQAAGNVVLATAVSGPLPPALKIESVHLWWTLDKAKTWLNAELKPVAGLPGSYSATLPGPPPADLVWYVDTVFRTKDLLPERFSLSTEPVLPAGWVPSIWAMP